MAIYRGSGGAGDATGDATNASQLALAAAEEAQASASSAEYSAANAATSATNAGNSATAAATSATNAAASASTASTQASNASNSATSAASSATAASSSASSASSSASAASTSATNAASSASAASTSASSASTSATNASNSASAAATSATNAANSATAAAASATAAATFDPALYLTKANPSFTGTLTGTGDIRLNNGTADGAQLQLASSGYSDWNLDNYSGRLRAYYGSTEYFTVTNSGNVGIGTSSPASKLNIVDASNTVNVRLESGSVIGQFFSSTSGGGVFLDANSSHPLVFRTAATERMRIDSSGNVGIGTTSPTTKLDIVGTLRLTNTSNAANYGLLSDLGGLYIQSLNSNPMYFATGGSERMRIDSSGNLGIGTSSPSKLLELGASNNTLTGTDANNTLRFTDTDISTAANQPIGKIEFVTSDTSTGGAGVAAYILSTALGTAGGGDLSFATSPNAGSGSPVKQLTITGAGNLQFNSGYGSVATAYGCRAWVNFNGTGTVAIRASGNVSSITDNGTGDYTVNFTTAMPDANYCCQITGSQSGPTNGNTYGVYLTGALTTSTARVINGRAAGALDTEYVNVSIFR